MPGFQSIEGLASGLDVTSIVDSIIEFERRPVAVLEQDKALKTQQVAAYRAVLAKFLSLETSASLLKKESQFNRYDVNISDEDILSATTSSDVAEGTYSVRVEQLATNHQIASQGFDETDEAIFGTGEIRLSLGTEGMTTIEIDNTNNTLIGIKDAINEASLGVTASIINDGSSSKPFRLLLTGENTGAGENINFEIDLSGGEDIDLTSGSFDNPEIISFSNNTTSEVSLGSTTAYTGNENKIYTFTVQNSGTIGSDNVTINWDDGTNSGSILVTEADSEVEVLNGGMAYDGLKLSFSAGDLQAGDTFQVGSFTPVLQEASNARVSIGGGGTGSPIIATSKTNNFKDIIPGLSLNVNNVNDPTNPNDHVTIKASRDTEAVKGLIQSFIDKYNDVMTFIEDQFSYDTETTESGVLFADYSLQVMQSTLRLATTSSIKGLEQSFSSLSTIGIRSDADGKLRIANSAALTNAIENNFDSLKDLFINSATVTNSAIEFISAGNDTKAGLSYGVDITQAAAKGYFEGSEIADPAVTPLVIDANHNEFQISVNGRNSELIHLSERTYTSGADLAEEIQNRLESDERLGNSNINVEWVDQGSTGYLKITSGAYGSRSSVEVLTTLNTANQLLGIHQGTAVNGLDVQGTIYGEAATGNGQYLEGNEDNPNTAGLRLKVSLTANDLTSGNEGQVTVVKGLGAAIEESLSRITTASDGIVDRRISSLNSQVTDLEDQIVAYDDRLSRRREDLFKQYTALETALSEYQSQSSYLQQQLSNIQSNFDQMFS